MEPMWYYWATPYFILGALVAWTMARALNIDLEKATGLAFSEKVIIAVAATTWGIWLPGLAALFVLAGVGDLAFNFGGLILASWRDRQERRKQREKAPT